MFRCFSGWMDPDPTFQAATASNLLQSESQSHKLQSFPTWRKTKVRNTWWNTIRKCISRSPQLIKVDVEGCWVVMLFFQAPSFKKKTMFKLLDLFLIFSSSHPCIHSTSPTVGASGRCWARQLAGSGWCRSSIVVWVLLSNNHLGCEVHVLFVAHNTFFSNVRRRTVLRSGKHTSLMHRQTWFLWLGDERKCCTNIQLAS